MRLRKIYGLFFITIIMAGVFLAFMYLFKEHNSANKVLEQLKARDRMLALSTWRAEFLSCPKNSPCEIVGEPSYNLQLPSITTLKEIIAHQTPTPDRVHMTYTLSENELTWIKVQKSLVLVVATNIHNSSQIRVGNYKSLVYGLYADSMFFIPKEEILAAKEIELFINFKNYPFFGPPDLPISFVHSQDVEKFVSLRTRAYMTSGVVRAQQYTVFLVVVAMALILDHSLTFLLLALYALARAIRGFMPFLQEVGLSHFAGQDIIYLAANISVFILLPLLLASVYKYKLTKKHVLTLGSMALIILPYVFWYTEDGNLKLDIVADVISSTLAVFVVAIAAYKKFIEKSQKKNSSLVAKGQSIKNSVYILRSAILIGALLVYALANLDDLRLVNTQEFKDVLDWRHALLLPTLIISALVEVGSMSKAMLLFSHKAVQQAILDRDLDMGREVQREMLPVRRFKSKNWHWRASYHPSTTMAGDWFDIVELKFADGHILLAAMLADITGHGISAAMMTSTVSSHWGLWLNSSREQNAPQGEEGKAWVENACKAVHAGLFAMKTNRGASAACILFDPRSHTLFYATPGHPGLLAEAVGEGFVYLSAKGKRLGGESFTVTAEMQNVSPGLKLCIFSDGIAPPETPISQWIKRLQRSCRDKSVNLVEQLVIGIKNNHKLFREVREKEDDMTLLVLTLDPVPAGDKISPQNPPDSGVTEEKTETITEKHDPILGTVA